MDDITIIYYTANRISEYFANNVRANIIEVSGGAPIISVSHKPIDFGKNICVGSYQPSAYRIYQQILVAAMFAETEYIVCCEDDSLYTEEHIRFKPSTKETFAYNINRWNVGPLQYFYRARCGMCMCVAPRDALVKVLCTRFAKFPQVLPREQLVGFGEPGRKDYILGLETPPLQTFTTEIPCLTFNHRDSTGGMRKILRKDGLCETLPFWGSATELWKKVHG